MTFINLCILIEIQNPFELYQVQSMKITLTDGMNFINLEVDTDQLVEDVKALLEVQTGLPLAQIIVTYEGKILQDQDRLSAKKINDGALLYFQVAPKAQPKPKLGGIADMIRNFDKKIKSVGEQGYQFNRRRVEQFQKQAQKLVDELKNDPYRLSQISVNYPEIGAAISKGDVQEVARIMHKKNEQKIKDLKQKQRRFIELSKDPMNPEYQKMLQQRIHQENIDKNLQFANEYLPQAFGHITMLYIKASINKIPINAFVDTGAQSTIMSVSLAERCGLMRLVDKRQAGKAVGVGSCKILGKVHAAEIEIEGKYLTCSFTVIENNSVEFLLGLDLLRRFNCTIDLGKNSLVFQNGMIATQFLSDGQVEKAKNPKLSKEELQVKVKKLTDMGFSKVDAIQTLRMCNYNEEVAGNMLMQNKFGTK